MLIFFLNGIIVKTEEIGNRQQFNFISINRYYVVFCPFVLKNIHKQEQIGVCLDTCHLNDAGYNVKDLDNLIDQIKNTISIEKVLAIHINDSKNPIGAHKDRHENLGYGYVGFDAINAIVHSEVFKDIPKILETPYIGDKPPYQKEIEMLKNSTLIPNWKDEF